MDSVLRELDEVKLELEKIKGECHIKTKLSESLRKANDDQAAIYQEVKLQMEKLTQELSMKAEEMAEFQQLYEDVNSRLQETEMSLKHASSVNEKLRHGYEQKVEKLEGENRKLVSALDEITSKNNELERQLCACHEEVASLKMLLSDLERKCLEAEKKIEVKKELRIRDDAIMKLEEESMSIQDRLKWKAEQFEHLKEAHNLLQGQFQSSKEEWASERNALIQEISSLQISLDTEIRMKESLQTELKICNQAMAHEESRRKALEIQLAESKLCFDNVLAECDEAKSKIENLRMERDEEVADLRNKLGTKKAHIKEMEYRISHLEQENKELLQSVKEFQEAQIVKKKPEPSLTKLRNKLRDLEQEHSRCSMNLEEREAEWNMKMEKLIGDMTRCECDLMSKIEENNQLKMQLKSCQSSIDVSGEDTSILTVQNSEFSEAYSKVFSLNPAHDAQKEKGEEKPVVSTEQEMASDSQLKAQLHLELEQARGEIASLSKKVESLKIMEDKNASLANELDKCKKMLKDSSTCQLRLKEHAALVEAQLRLELEQAREEITSLSKRVESLKTVEDRTTLLANELDKCKKMLEESSIFQLRLKEHAALMEASAKEMRDATINLQKEKDWLEHECKRRESLAVELERSKAEKYKQEMEKLRIIAEDKDQSIRDLQAFVSTQEQNFMDAIVSSFSETLEMLVKRNALVEALEKTECLVAELASSEGEKFKQEVEKLNVIVEDKDQNIRNLQALVSTQEQNFMDAIVSSFSEAVEMVVKSNALIEALEKAECLVTAEVEEKRSLVCKFEKETADLRAKMLCGEESLFYSQKRVKDLETSLKHQVMEMDILKDNLSNVQSNYEKAEKELQSTEQALREDISKLSHEQDGLIAYFEGVCERLGGFCGEDARLMGILDKMVHDCEGNGLIAGITRGNEAGNVVKDDSLSNIAKGIEGNVERRSPLRVLNQ